MITRLNLEGITSILTVEDLQAAIQAHAASLAAVLQGEVGGPEDLGWFHPEPWENTPLLAQIEILSEQIRAEAEVFVLIGIGGSNRGAQSVIETLGDRAVEIVYAGDHCSTHALQGVIQRLHGRSTYLNVIAKDFNTLEPGIAFRLLRQALETEPGWTGAERIIVTGSAGAGQLLSLGQQQGYRCLPFPPDMGGRFSVLSAVGLLPMAVAGVDIRALIRGASAAANELKALPLAENPAVLYALGRNLLAERGFLIENLITFEPALRYFARWWSQLFGESEGKAGRGIFPTTSAYSEDLHAIGQYIQQGKRIVMETFLQARFPHPEIVIQPSQVPDGFAYLDHQPFDLLNSAVYAAAYTAHSQAGVPCFQFQAGEISPAMFGELFYLFMLSCCLSAVTIGVNPYGQPGVEAYKQNMYRILGKPIGSGQPSALSRQQSAGTVEVGRRF